MQVPQETGLIPCDSLIILQEKDMKTQQAIDYQRIAEAIRFLKSQYRNQPSLDEAAAHINLSPFHFQRMFKEWAGISPKQFLQYLSIEHAKRILKETEWSLTDAAYETGLSGTGRLHDLFIKIEGMTPGEYKNGGESLRIYYQFSESPFGPILIASTDKGICYITFVDSDDATSLEGLKNLFPRAHYLEQTHSLQQEGLSIFRQDWTQPTSLKLHLKGTPFQIKIWETLLKIPSGGLTTYGTLAEKAGYPGASRAVGTAVGNNPIAVIIPCHRVIKSTGETGQYHWGRERKNAIIGWEAARTEAME